VSDLIPDRPIAPDPRLMALTAEERLRRAMSLVDDMAANVVELGRVIYAMKQSGDDLMAVRRRFSASAVGMLFKIGCGQVNPATYLNFGGRPSLYRPVSRLDLGEQQRLAEGGRINVVVYNPRTGETDVRAKTAAELDDEEIARVFADGAIRTEAEQRAILDRQGRAAVIRQRVETVGKITVDKDRDGIVLHGFASRADVKRALKLLE